MVGLDWWIIGVYVAVVTGIGILFCKKASGSLAEFFVAGRNLPWWLAGTSLIATSFAADTPLAITGIVAEKGIAGNWLWWNQVVVWILAVVFFARLWRRSGILTDAEFIEIRYGGRAGSFLRGFKAFYQSVIISTYALAWVMLAVQKIVSATLETPQWVPAVQTQLESGFGLAPGSIDVWKWFVLLSLFFVATLYTAVSGFWGIVVTDLFQFTIAMAASVIFAFYAIDAVGGLAPLKAGLVSRFGEGGADDIMSFMPRAGSPWMPLTTFAIFLGVLWWGDCGGFVAQRLFSTRTDRDSVLTALWYSLVHFALRPWPWIVVALVTLVYYPRLEDPELGYPMLMMDILPAGLRGLMVASLLAAFMSTVDTHLNLNASYFVNDIYKRFLAPGATEARCVWISRLSTIGFAALAIIVAYFMTSIKDAWLFLFNLQAGLGLVLMLRWFWWRVNVWSEISAMIASLVVTPAVRIVRSYCQEHYGLNWSDAMCVLITVVVCTVTWLVVTWLTPPSDPEKLESFYRRVRPSVGFWKPIAGRCADVMPRQLGWRTGLVWLLGVTALYAVTFGVGKLILGVPITGVVLLVIGMITTITAFRLGTASPRSAGTSATS
ncbi:MAG: sodium:solute symporter family protein [Phycisphaerae bacterium]